MGEDGFCGKYGTILSGSTPKEAADRISVILQEAKGGRRRIRPYSVKELVQGTQRHNNALGVLALVARATGGSAGRDAYGRTGSWAEKSEDIQDARQRKFWGEAMKRVEICLCYRVICKIA